MNSLRSRKVSNKQNIKNVALGGVEMYFKLTVSVLIAAETKFFGDTEERTISPGGLGWRMLAGSGGVGFHSPVGEAAALAGQGCVCLLYWERLPGLVGLIP